MTVELAHRTVRTNGIDMHVVEQGSDGPVIVLCHGFPELWYSWRHQLPGLAGAGYRAVAPDQRGYGRTSAPDEVEAYGLRHLTGDLAGLLDDLGEERAIFVGHDWGSVAVWAMSILHPERVAGVVGVSVPYVPRAPAPPLHLLKMVSGDRFNYLLYFQEPGVAERELETDPREGLRTVYAALSGDAPPGSFHRIPKDGGTYLAQFAEPSGLPGWLTEADLDVFAAEFTRTGFRGGLNWYRNMDLDWSALEGEMAGAHVTVPALFVGGDRDPVLRLTPPAVMDGWLDDPRGQIILPGVGHWIQQEAPDQVSRAIIDFAQGLAVPKP